MRRLLQVPLLVPLCLPLLRGLAHVGIPTRIDAQHAIAHNKVMIIDGAIVITGSFNFTMAAEMQNAENLLVIRSKELAARYTENWEAHAAHSEPYIGRGR